MSDETKRYVQVAIDVPLRQVFDYALKPDMPTPRLGTRVRVPFAARQCCGVVMQVDVSPSIESRRIKRVSEILDKTPLLNEVSLRFAERIARYYHQPIGQVLFTFFPSKLRQAKTIERRAMPHYRPHLTHIAQLSKPLSSAKQQHVLDWLIQRCDAEDADQYIARSDCLAHISNCGQSLNALEKKQLISTRDQLLGGLQAQPAEKHLQLNAQQQAAVDAINAAHDTFAPMLLDGITGSGKTEVYIQAIAHTLARGKRALLLVPEIGLTPQLTERFLSRLDAKVGLLHSSQTDTTRAETWLAAAQGDIDLMIGTRSALFAPLVDVGLIIVDEEHEPAYKQQEGIRYHARDMAVLLGQLSKAPVVLGSATPSLETLYNVETGRYRRHRLTKRAGDAQLPTMRTIDMRAVDHRRAFSDALLASMREHLQAGHQVMLLLNRRGYAPTLFCHACSSAIECPNCTAHMVYHKNQGILCCHHCTYQYPVPKTCAGCGSDQLVELGYGTQRIESQLQAWFADYPIVRIDHDTTSQKGALEQTLAQVHQGEPMIMIGTQMLAKGHHFSDVTLVGVLNMDHGFYSSDYRALERMGQLILQVAGRAGRGQSQGTMLLQTHQPESEHLQRLLKQGYGAFANALLAERALAELPPYSYHALLLVEAPDEQLSAEAIAQLVNCWPFANDAEVSLLGPLPAPMQRRAGMFRHEAIITANQRPALQQAIRAWLSACESLNLSHKVFWTLDIDPIGQY